MCGVASSAGEQPAVDGGFVLPDVERRQGRFAAGGRAVHDLPREEFMRMAPGFIRPNSRRRRPCGASKSSSGVWKVRMSASRATSSSVRNPHRSRSSRGGSQQTTRNPMFRHTLSRAIRRVPRPRFPSVRSAGCQPCVRERWTSAAPTHCSTPRALQPAAVVDFDAVRRAPRRVDVVEADGRRGDQLYARIRQ